MIEVQRHQNARAFLDRAEGWLLQAEAENNLLLGIAGRLIASPDRYKPPVYLATVEEEGKVVGCAFRTPPDKLGLTRMPLSALPVLVDDVAEVYTTLPAVMGPEEVAKLYSELWGAKKGVCSGEGMRQRIYQLDKGLPLKQILSGQIRAVKAKEIDIAAEWINSFSNIHAHHIDPKRLAEEMIRGQDMFFWDDDRPVSMAGWTGKTPNGARIGFVYTPPVYRKKGYATACVAGLSKRLLDSGKRFCFLYADLSKPSSNSIYQKIGYKPVCDVVDWNFKK